jgi:hypothetical protein
MPLTSWDTTGRTSTLLLLPRRNCLVEWVLSLCGHKPEQRIMLWMFPCLFSYVFHLFFASLYFSSHDYSFTLVILTQPILFLVTWGRSSLISSIVILCILYTLPTCSLPYHSQVFAFHCNLSYSLRS